MHCMYVALSLTGWTHSPFPATMPPPSSRPWRRSNSRAQEQSIRSSRPGMPLACLTDQWATSWLNPTKVPAAHLCARDKLLASCRQSCLMYMSSRRGQISGGHRRPTYRRRNGREAGRSGTTLLSTVGKAACQLMIASSSCLQYKCALGKWRTAHAKRCQILPVSPFIPGIPSEMLSIARSPYRSCSFRSLSLIRPRSPGEMDSLQG
mmetsp:Transcript_78525/g.222097  ORF Transcript_78525/g.222097 Transcript_78525/m.222097 type:complete len:207 (-) Transcript_78525:103-723(-)